VIDEVKLWLRKRHCLRAKQLATTFRYHHHPRPPPPPRASERRDSMPVDMENAILVAAAFILVLLLPYVDKQRSHTSHSAFSSWLDIRKIKARCGTKARCFIVMSVSFPWVLQVLVVVVRGWLWWWSLCGSQSGGGRFYFFRIVRTRGNHGPRNDVVMQPDSHRIREIKFSLQP
jgi:hypothetical protein